MALTRLAAGCNADCSDTGALLLRVDVLEDLPARALELMFTQMEKTWTLPVLPIAGEMRELAEQMYREELARERERSERELAEADKARIRSEQDSPEYKQALDDLQAAVHRLTRESFKAGRSSVSEDEWESRKQREREIARMAVEKYGVPQETK